MYACMRAHMHVCVHCEFVRGAFYHYVSGVLLSGGQHIHVYQCVKGMFSTCDENVRSMRLTEFFLSAKSAGKVLSYREKNKNKQKNTTTPTIFLSNLKSLFQFPESHYR